MDLGVLFEPTIDLRRLTETLDGLGHEGRLHAVRAWKRKTQGALFDAAKGYMPLDLDFLVPKGVGPLAEVVHDGQNTLPTFHRFQKRFCILENHPAEVVGYNHQTLRPLTGPGYFTVTEGSGDHQGELAIDYREIPKSKPPSWPSLSSNESGLAALVYGGMVDYLRGLSKHVSIGRAFKGTSMNAWFALVRRDVS